MRLRWQVATRHRFCMHCLSRRKTSIAHPVILYFSIKFSCILTYTVQAGCFHAYTIFDKRRRWCLRSTSFVCILHDLDPQRQTSQTSPTRCVRHMSGIYVCHVRRRSSFQFRTARPYDLHNSAAGAQREFFSPSARNFVAPVLLRSTL